MQAVEVQGGVDVQLWRCGDLGQRAGRDLDISCLIPPDVLRVQTLHAQCPGDEQQQDHHGAMDAIGPQHFQRHDGRPRLTTNANSVS